ncbi:MAG: glycosyltransferase [Candidatus Hodarchaeota archaeon]
MKKLNIAVVWYFDKAKWVEPYWRDGHRAAFDILKKKHNVDFLLGTDFKLEDNYDFILLWDSSNSEFIPQLREYKAKKGLCLTTDLGINMENLHHFDVIFPEAEPVYQMIRNSGFRAIKAFGADTNFYTNEDTQVTKYFPAFYPATFSPWKRQDLYAEAVRDNGMALGTIQPDGLFYYRKCIEYGVRTIVGYVPAETVRDFYRMSKVVVVPSWEGSGRTVLEAMAMDIPVIVTKDNHKAASYMREAGVGEIVDPTPEALQKAFWKVMNKKVKTRDFILKNYSGEVFAEQLLKGIENG